MGNFKPRGYGVRYARPRVSRRKRFPELAEVRKPKTTTPRQISFTIAGNPADVEGNPLPKAKLTGGQHWTKKAKDYAAWKKYVATAFLDAAPDDVRAVCAVRHALGGKPIPSFVGRASMVVVAHYRNHRHPDTENVFGSIADALFDNDTNLAGAFDFTVGQPKLVGTVTVTLTLPDIF